MATLDYLKDQYMGQRQWRDTTFGKNGYALWIAPAALTAIIYQASSIILNIDRIAENNKVLLIYVIVLVSLFFLALVGLIAIIQGTQTAQRILTHNTDTYFVSMYFGRKLCFKVDQVIDIIYSKTKLFSSFITPLGRGGEIYQVKLANGKSFFISAAMPESPKLIESLKKEKAN